MLILTCTTLSMMMMSMENVTLIVGKCGGMSMQAHVPMLLLTSRTTRNISSNGMSGRRSRKGRGPKASWSGEVWNTLSGVISRSSTASPGESTMIKNGKCINVKDMKKITTDDDDDLIAFPTMPCTSASNNIHRTKVPSEGLGSKALQCHGITSCWQS